MNLNKKIGIIAIFLFCVSVVRVPVRADIYRFKDENGVWHFTNIKTDPRYRIFIRTKEQTSEQYIHDYEKIISQAARRYGVEPSLIKAVIKAESDFDREAISHKGAQGLMQLMPETASELDVSDPFNPRENIFGGTRYLGSLLRKFNNDKIKALAAYNAGPELVTKSGGIPSIPETREFVKRVMKYYQKYQAVK